MFKSFVAIAIFAAIIGAPAEAQKGRRGEQDAALQATRDGAVHSLRSIENSVVPGMQARGADYIGAEFDAETLRYRLKFMNGKAVIWLDFDGRNGKEVGRTGGK